MQVKREGFCFIRCINLKPSKKMAVGGSSWMHFCKSYIMFYTLLVGKRVNQNQHVFICHRVRSTWNLYLKTLRIHTQVYEDNMTFIASNTVLVMGTFVFYIFTWGKQRLDHAWGLPRVGFQIASASCIHLSICALHFCFWQEPDHRLGFPYLKFLGSEVFWIWDFFFFKLWNILRYLGKGT